jgi:hypothetical protein
MAPSDWEDGEDEYQQEDDFDIEDDFDVEDDIDYEGIAQDAAERRALSDEHDSDADIQDDADGLDEDDYQSSVLQISLPQDQGAVNTIRNILFGKSSYHVLYAHLLPLTCTIPYSGTVIPDLQPPRRCYPALTGCWGAHQPSASLAHPAPLPTQSLRIFSNDRTPTGRD